MSPCLNYIADTDMERIPCPHIIAVMDMDMAPCLHLITHMDLDIITYMDLDLTPCPHITAQSGYGSMYAYYCSHGYEYDSMSAYLSH